VFFEADVSGGESESSSAEFGAVDFADADDGADDKGVLVVGDVGVGLCVVDAFVPAEFFAAGCSMETVWSGATEATDGCAAAICWRWRR